MTKKKTRSKKTQKPRKKKNNDVLDQRVEHFGEEIDKLAEKVGKHLERRNEEWDSWFHRTFGIVGPLISSIFGLVILVLIMWAIGFVNLPIGSGFLADIYAFLLNNMGLFFLIFLFFSYMSYFSKAFSREYRLLSPIAAAAGITIGFWIAIHALDIVSLHVGNTVIASIASYIAFYIEETLFWIFSIVLVVGYIALSIRIATEKPLKQTEQTKELEENIIVKKERPGARKTQRIYRSGKNRILGGVCGGIAEYFGVDPVLIRLLWIVGTFAWGFGLALYIIAWIIIPRNPRHKWD